MTEVTDTRALLRHLQSENTRWNAVAEFGTPVIVTYHFQEGSDLPAPDDMAYETATVVAFNDVQRAQFRKVVAEFEANAGIVFVEVENGAMINVNGATGTPWGGWAAYPSSSDYRTVSISSKGLEGNFTMDVGRGGDLTATAWLESMIHEMGHAMGLEHPFEEDGDDFWLSEADALNSTSVMSYANAVDANGRNVYFDTLRALDIEALQDIYGAPGKRPEIEVRDNGLKISGDGAADVLLGARGENLMLGRGGSDWMMGRESDDTLKGGGGRDALFGKNGDDRVVGGGGNDWIEGGRGDDKLFGGSGNDRILAATRDGLADSSYDSNLLKGGRGNDRMTGDFGADRMDGGAGRDVMRGGYNDDRMAGGNGNDRIRGDQGADTLLGGGGADRLWGGDQNDTLKGGGGKDRLDGGSGNDILEGGGGRDVMKGGAGYDLFVFTRADRGERNIIKDYESFDRMDVAKAGFDYYDADARVVGGGKDVLVTWGGDRGLEILLEDVSASVVYSGWF